MLSKGFFFELSQEDVDVYMHHYVQLQQICIQCWGIPAREDKLYMPSCHVVASAYEKAFGVPAVHGRKVYVSGLTHNRFFDLFRISGSNYVHSWNLLTLPSGISLILDLFPDESCSLSPLILQAPNPAYSFGYEKVERICRERLDTPAERASTEFLAEEFKKIIAAKS